MGIFLYTEVVFYLSMGLSFIGTLALTASFLYLTRVGGDDGKVKPLRPVERVIFAIVVFIFAIVVFIGAPGVYVLLSIILFAICMLLLTMFLALGVGNL